MSAVSSVLIPVIKLWLRSQVEHLDDLDIVVDGKSRQLLGGDIPKAVVSARGVKYQGLAITNVGLTAEAIHLNIAQILKGEALRLLDPILVNLEVEFAAADLQHCLQSPLLLEAIAADTAPTINSDAEVRNLLETLLHKLGDQFTLDELSIVEGGAKCRGQFAIAAT